MKAKANDGGNGRTIRGIGGQGGDGARVVRTSDVWDVGRPPEGGDVL